VRIQNDDRVTPWLDTPPQPEFPGIARRSWGVSPLYDGDAQIKQTIQSGFESQFKQAAGDPEAFHALMKEAYGENYDRTAAESLRSRALKNDFSWLPKMEFRSNQTLQGANGAYDASRNVVYINEKYKSDPARATKVYTEEAGAYLDTQLNTADTPGDEGEMFRKLLAGTHLSDAEKAAIRADDDRHVITVDGKKTQVEFSFLDDIGDAISDGVSAVGGAISDAAGAVGGAISDGGKAVGGAFADAASWVGSTAGDAWDGIMTAANWIGPRIWDAGRGLATGFIDTITGSVRNLWEGIKTFGSGIGDIFEGNFADGLKEMGMGLVKVFVQTPVDGFLLLGGRAVSAVQTLVGLEPPGRKLTSDEINELRAVYGDSIDYSKVEIKEGFSGVFSVTGLAFTHGNTIYIPSKYLPLSQNKGTLVHEMAHVWQNQHGGTDYMSEALWAQKLGDGYDFAKGIEEGKSWEDLNPEQQAELMEQAYDYGYFDVTNPNYGTFKYNGKDYTAYVANAVRQMLAGEGAP
jgi:hypothetical protein